MALPQLLEALRDQAAATRAAERARAERLSEDIRARSRAELEQRRGELLSRTRREAEQAAQREASAARAEGAERELIARARLLARIRSAVERRIQSAAADPGYLESLAHDVGAALERLPPGEVIVRAHPDLASHISHAAKGREGVRVEPTEHGGMGFTASSAGLALEVDATLEARLEYAWSRLAVSALGEIEQ